MRVLANLILALDGIWLR